MSPRLEHMSLETPPLIFLGVFSCGEATNDMDVNRDFDGRPLWMIQCDEDKTNDEDGPVQLLIRNPSDAVPNTGHAVTSVTIKKEG